MTETVDSIMEYMQSYINQENLNDTLEDSDRNYDVDIDARYERTMTVSFEDYEIEVRLDIDAGYMEYWELFDANGEGLRHNDLTKEQICFIDRFLEFYIEQHM